jgi:hypothetical protein
VARGIESKRNYFAKFSKENIMPSRRKSPATPTNPEMHARKIADSAEAAWHGSYGTGRLDVPVSVIATLAALPSRDSHGNDVAISALEWNVDDFMVFARRTWSAVIRSRPEITHLVYPIISWIFDDTETTVYPHAHAVAQAALRARQPDLTGTDRRFDIDLLGGALTLLRAKSALQARGQFYTPTSVAAMLARMSDVEEHRVVADPTLGTGGLFRAVAEVMREQGRDPGTVRWVGCDVDPIAVACATVNSMIWGLGHDIVFHVGNAFTPGWETVALAQRAELRRLATEVERGRGLLALLRSIH